MIFVVLIFLNYMSALNVFFPSAFSSQENNEADKQSRQTMEGRKTKMSKPRQRLKDRQRGIVHNVSAVMETFNMARVKRTQR